MQIVLFQKIQFIMSTQFICQKHFYFKLFSLTAQVEFELIYHVVIVQYVNHFAMGTSLSAFG